MKTATLLAAVLPVLLCTSCGPGMLMQQRVDWEVTCDVQIVSLPEELATPLIPGLRDPRRVEEAFAQVQKLLADKRATLVGWPMLTTKSGQRAVVEQIDEIRYATEYQAPSIGITPTPSIDQPVDQPVKVQPKIDITALDATPTAFETRNTGVTFEVEPVVAADGASIDINMVPQSIRLLGGTTATIEKDPPGAKLIVNQPRFYTNKLTTSMNFQNGERKLIGIFKLPAPPGGVELFIMRVDALKRKIAMTKPPGTLLGGQSSGALAPQ